jgi:hypothetical protein
VNRVWHHYFGQGIVATPGNFGRSGIPPTHPELLDWLAVDFVEHNWNLKRLHKQIMTSTVYRQSSSQSTASSQTDRAMLAAMPLRRLESEIIRDSILSVSGKLDPTTGGPPVMITNPGDGLSREQTSPTPSSHLRRSLYLFARRVYPLTFLEVFDSPIVPINCTKRMTSATVLQSFTQLNDEFMTDNAVAVARRVYTRAGDDAPQQVRSAFRIVLSRESRQDEEDRCVEFLQTQRESYAETSDSQSGSHSKAVADLCHMLMCTNEFLYIE